MYDPSAWSDGYSPLWKSIAIIPKFTGSLSIVASCLLAKFIVKKDLRKASLTDLMMFSISIMDMIGSFFGDFLSSWMAPKGLPYEYGLPFAAGNIATCEAQGFIVTMHMIFFFTVYAELAALYWLIVGREWSKDFMKETKITLVFLLPPPIMAIAVAIPPLFFDMYNVSVYNCQVNPYPYTCDNTEDADCIRGLHATKYQIAMITYGLICNFVVIIFMCLLVHLVYNRERKTDRYLTAGQERSRAQTTKTAWQGIRYAGAFTALNLSWYIFLGFTIVPWPWSSTGFIVASFLEALLCPLMGFINAAVYFYPRYLSYKEQHNDQSRT